MIALLLVLALAAITMANLIIAWEGPSAAPYVALGLVALDLVLRDVLHDRTSGRQRVAVIGALIVAGSAITLALSPSAGTVALASSAAFAAALTVDAVVYQVSRFLPWLERTMRSNVAAAIVDSAVFVAIAFPGFLWGTFVVQAGMKIGGAVVFALLLERLVAVGVYRRVTATA